MNNTQMSVWRRWLITITVMLVAVAEILDTTIVNVALPDIMGSLGARTDQIAWILTAYLVSAAVVMPLTGFLSTRFGTKRLLLVNIAGFCLASALCGLSDNLSQIVAARLLQGIFGASLVPLSQSTLLEIFPRESHGKAMAIWGIGIMAGPVLGPTLGGYITDSLSWRWIFYINVPVCCTSFFLALKLFRYSPPQKVQIDWLGLFLMAIGIMALQYFLDRGNEENWFESHAITVSCVIWVISLGVFIVRGLHLKDRNIVDISLFKDRNFLVSSIIVMIFLSGMFGTMSTLPLFLESLLGYPTLATGIMLAPQGIMSAISMAVVSQLINRVDSRYLIAFGSFVAMIGSYLRSFYTLNVDQFWIIMPQILVGIGLGFFFVPLATMAFSTLPNEKRVEASGLYSFCRNLGGSLGISLITTMLSRQIQVNWQNLSGNINVFNPNLHNWLELRNLKLNDPVAFKTIAGEVTRQASMIAYVDIYRIIAWLFLLVIPLIFIVKLKK